MSCVLRISVITIWTVEPWMKTPALLCLRFQALAEALKINSSVTKIDLEGNQIGDEGAEAWCVGWAPQNRWMLRQVMLSCCHVFDILLQWEVWMVCRCCSFIVHLCSRLVVKYVDAASYCSFLECSCNGSIREILVKLNVVWSEDFRSKVLSVGRLKSSHQPWSVAASRPWPRHCRSTSPSWTSTGNTTTLVPRVPRPGVRLSPLNAAACIHVMSSTFFDRKKCCLFGGAVVSSFISDRGELSNM